MPAVESAVCGPDRRLRCGPSRPGRPDAAGPDRPRWMPRRIDRWHGTAGQPFRGPTACTPWVIRGIGVQMMEIKTSRFGVMTVDEQRLMTFPRGLLGLSQSSALCTGSDRTGKLFLLAAKR